MMAADCSWLSLADINKNMQSQCECCVHWHTKLGITNCQWRTASLKRMITCLVEPRVGIMIIKLSD